MRRNRRQRNLFSYQQPSAEREIEWATAVLGNSDLAIGMMRDLAQRLLHRNGREHGRDCPLCKQEAGANA